MSDAAKAIDVLQIHASDNVCVATRPLTANTWITCGSVRFKLDQDVTLGAKLALGPLAAGTKILKFGEPIGTLTQAVALGGYIHTHNLKSDYLHTHERGEQLD